MKGKSKGSQKGKKPKMTAVKKEVRTAKPNRGGLNIPKGKKLALISVTEKKGIVEFAQRLVKMGYLIVSTSGTAALLEKNGFKVIQLSKIVGEEILGGRVKSLSREVHAGVLAQFNEADQATMEKDGNPYIHLVCVDYYALEKTIAEAGGDIEAVIANTDIGGPAVTRSAAKGGRIIISDPADREWVLERMESRKDHDLSSFDIQYLRAKGEYMVSRYCLASAKFHSRGQVTGLIGHFLKKCKYGENPYMNDNNTGLYSVGSSDPLALEKFQLIEGTDPSFINYTDMDRLLQTITHIAAGFDVNFGRVPLIAVAVKHGNPCGAAVGYDPKRVIAQMAMGDHLAIFGGLVMTNFPLTEELVELLMTINQPQGKRLLLDGVMAPHVTDEAIALLKRKTDKCRILLNKHLMNLNQNSLDASERIRPVRGGFLRQPNYTYILDLSDKQLIITLPKNHDGLTELDYEDIILAWGVGATSNSNTTCLTRQGQLLGDGVGQQSRVASCQVTVFRARESGHQIGASVAYTDSFCPEPDGPEVLADAGVSILFASSGSVKDEIVQQACQKRGLVLIQLPDKVCRGFFGH